MAKKKRVEQRPPPWPQYQPGPWRLNEVLTTNRSQIVDANGESIDGLLWANLILGHKGPELFELLHAVCTDLEDLVRRLRELDPKAAAPASFLRVNALVTEIQVACQEKQADDDQRRADRAQAQAEQDKWRTDRQRARKRAVQAPEPGPEAQGHLDKAAASIEAAGTLTAESLDEMAAAARAPKAKKGRGKKPEGPDLIATIEKATGVKVEVVEWEPSRGGAVAAIAEPQVAVGDLAPAAQEMVRKAMGRLRQEGAA